MSWVGVVVVAVIVVSLVVAARLVEHRRYRGIPVRADLTGRDRRRAVRHDRAAMTRRETPARYVSGEGTLAAGGTDGGDP